MDVDSGDLYKEAFGDLVSSGDSFVGRPYCELMSALRAKGHYADVWTLRASNNVGGQADRGVANELGKRTNLRVRVNVSPGTILIPPQQISEEIGSDLLTSAFSGAGSGPR